MDGSILTAMVGLAGAVIGGLTSFVTSWLTLHKQMRQNRITVARDHREAIYRDFIKEAARLFGDALGHERADISDLVTLYAIVAHIRLLASDEIVSRAERVLEAIVATYLSPNRTLHELHQFAQEGGLDPLRRFSTACRLELEVFDKL